jgi:methyl-accepting chemotaxis protein
MNASLVHIVSGVRRGTDMIATASSQIASGNLDLSSRTEQQPAPGGNRLLDGRADLHRAAEQRQCP